MKKYQLHDCPVCGTELQVKVLACPSCRTRIEGSFSAPDSRLFSLSRENLEFIETFVRARGSIKEMEKILGVSYPTVRGMLDTVIFNLGYPVAQRPELSADRKREILDRLESGEIDAKQAAELFKVRDEVKD